MLRHMFYFGVLLPTLVVVIFFVVFLICWYKCNLRHRYTKPFHGGSHNSTQSSIVSARDFTPTSNGPPSKEFWENEDNESRCGMATLYRQEHEGATKTVCSSGNKYVPGEFRSLQREPWRYMSSNSITLCRVDAPSDHCSAETDSDTTDHRQQQQIWTTRCEESDSSLDSESALTTPWLAACHGHSFNTRPTTTTTDPWSMNNRNSSSAAKTNAAMSDLDDESESGVNCTTTFQHRAEINAEPSIVLPSFVQREQQNVSPCTPSDCFNADFVHTADTVPRHCVVYRDDSHQQRTAAPPCAYTAAYSDFVPPNQFKADFPRPSKTDKQQRPNACHKQLLLDAHGLPKPEVTTPYCSPYAITNLHPPVIRV